MAKSFSRYFYNMGRSSSRNIALEHFDDLYSSSKASRNEFDFDAYLSYLSKSYTEYSYIASEAKKRGDVDSFSLGCCRGFLDIYDDYMKGRFFVGKKKKK